MFVHTAQTHKLKDAKNVHAPPPLELKLNSAVYLAHIASTLQTSVYHYMQIWQYTYLASSPGPLVCGEGSVDKVMCIPQDCVEKSKR